MWATCHYRSCDFLPTLGKTRPSDGWRVDGFTYEAAVSVTLITVLFVIRIAKWSSQRDQSHKKKTKNTETPAKSNTRSRPRFGDAVRKIPKSNTHSCDFCPDDDDDDEDDVAEQYMSPHTPERFFFFYFPMSFSYMESTFESFRVWKFQGVNDSLKVWKRN